MIIFTSIAENITENHQKFNKIYEHFYLYAYKVAFEIIRDAQKMEDVMQSVFINVWHILNKISDEQNIKALIFVIARNTAINESKKYQTVNSKCIAADEDNMRDPNDYCSQNPADIVVNQENIQYIYVQIKSLKAIYSDVLLLYLKFQCTPEEIADILHINIKTVYTRLDRGKKLLRKKLEEKGGSDNE